MDIQYTVKKLLLETPGLTEGELIEIVRNLAAPTPDEVMNNIYLLKASGAVEEKDGYLFRVIVMSNHGKETILESKDQEATESSEGKDNNLSYF